jgi:hypothetical protein
MGNYFQRTTPTPQAPTPQAPTPQAPTPETDAQPIEVQQVQSISIPNPIDVYEPPVLPIVCITPTLNHITKSTNVSSIRSAKSFTFDEVVPTKKRKYCDDINQDQLDCSSITPRDSSTPRDIEHVSTIHVPQNTPNRSPRDENDDILHKKMMHLTL